MKKILVGFALLGMLAGVSIADDDNKPNLIFNPDTCMLRITPQDGQLLDDWYVCVTDRAYIGIHHLNENIECEEIVEITPHFSINMTEYLDDCHGALPSYQLYFGTLKTYYK